MISYAWRTFRPFHCEDEQAGCLLIGLRCMNCAEEFSSVDLSTDTDMFRQVVDHACSENVRM